MKSDSSQQQRRKIQTLQYLNSVLSDLTSNGFNLNPLIIQKICKKKIINIQDIEQLEQLSVGQENHNLHKQNKGQYQRVNYQQISLQKYKNMNSLTMASQRQENVSTSSYDKKMETMTRGVKIIVKVKRK